MLITPEILKSLGFDYVMSDYWRKGEFSLYRSYRDNKISFIIGPHIKDDRRITTVEELKFYYKEITGEEL